MKPGSVGSAVLFSIIPAVILIGGIWLLDKKEKEPIRFLALAIGFGAVLAPAIAFGLQKAFDVPTSISGAITVPNVGQLSVGTAIIEEIVRGLAILAVFFLVRVEVDDPLDGLVYGANVGAGFFLTAQFFSILTSHSFGDASATQALFANMIAAVNHIFYGAVIGLFIGWARKLKVSGIVVAALFGIGVAMMIHLLHDYLPSAVSSSNTAVTPNTLAGLLANLPNYLGLLGVAVIVVWLLGREGVLIAEGLQDEVASGVVPQSDYLTLTRPGRRFAVLTRDMFTKPKAWGERRRLYALETELAFRKYHRKTDNVQQKHYKDEDEYRREITAARAELGEALAAEGVSASTPEPPPSTLWAGLGGLSIVAVLAAMAVLSYVFFFNNSSGADGIQNGNGQPLAASTTGAAPAQIFSVSTGDNAAADSISITPAAFTGSSQAAPRALAPRAAGSARLVAISCQRLYSGCGYRQSHLRNGLYFVLQCLNCRAGVRIDFRLYSVQYRTFVTNPFGCVTNGASDQRCYKFFRGPFRAGRYVMQTYVSGQPVKSPVLVLY